MVPTKASTNEGQLQMSKASHTLDQDSVKLNQVWCPKIASTIQAIYPNKNPQPIHLTYLLIYVSKHIIIE